MLIPMRHLGRHLVGSLNLHIAVKTPQQKVFSLSNPHPAVNTIN